MISHSLVLYIVAYSRYVFRISDNLHCKVPYTIYFRKRKICVSAQMQQAEPLVIETPEAATEGSIRVYDYDGCCIYAYYGKIRINNDGKDGKDIDVEAIGYLEGYQEHKEESGARE